MSLFRNYLYAQLKRVLRILPGLLAVNLAACACIGLLAVLLLRDSMAENSRKYRIGIVGEIADSYVGLQVFQLLVNMDDSRYMLELERLTEEEAAQKLRRGELSVYLRVPDGLVEALDRGANDIFITCVSAKGQEGISGVLAEEIADIASVLVEQSQSAVFGMQRLLSSHDRNELWEEATEKMCFLLAELALNRTGLCDVEILGISNGLSTGTYYFCSLLVFILLLAGINNSPLFAHRSTGLPKLLASRGIGAGVQVICEFVAYLCLTGTCLIGVFLIGRAAMDREYFVIAEWNRRGSGALMGFFLSLLPVAVMLAALQFFLYELVTGIVGSLLLQFICAVGMGYLAGCFYPTSFFPEAVRRIGENLPAGLALRYVDTAMIGELPLTEGVGICLYALAFLGLTVLVRKARLRKG